MMSTMTNLSSGRTSRPHSSPSTSPHSCSGAPGNVCAGRVWLRMWGEGKGETVTTKTEGSVVGPVREAESSPCGIDESTGQCTPGDTCAGQPLVTGHRNSCEGVGKEEDITSLKLTPHHQEQQSVMSPETHTGHGEEEEEEEEGAEISTVIEKRGRGRNRHARVVGGRLLFRPVGSLNGDTCSVNSPPPVCKLEPCMLGPSEFKPLKCALTEEDRSQTGPLSPCSTKCCKVRFNRTIEVRQARSESTVRREPAPLMPVWKVASLSLVFGIVWFFANYLYALALVSKSVALVNTLSSMSSVFVMIMAAVPLLPREPGDKITLSRVLVSLLSVGGAGSGEHIRLHREGPPVLECRGSSRSSQCLPICSVPCAAEETGTES
ncbi:Solute carrier family 35 member F5 [Geodia barretti]|uniref:Solute carrier family 35 member F5 n=1 Tax=Geodia barretti TaxID=519541 RepID=A0AA35TC81_GEOBA|nr:Solute carrier family 35 member F5 [Geodia barretti]